MRISDWSSDVCSSDLEQVRQQVRIDRAAPRAAPQPALSPGPRKQRQGQQRPQPVRAQEVQRFERLRERLRTHVDRKSGVEGKSGSVRVDLGGRRILKKKKHKIEEKCHNTRTENTQRAVH